jgi:hypothetical protein
MRTDELSVSLFRHGESISVGGLSALAKPARAATAMGFATSSDMRPIWPLDPSGKMRSTEATSRMV